MPDPNQRDAKLIQYLNEAYGKEKELEVALVADIALTIKPPYKKRLQQHLKETKGHAKALERRIKKLGGSASTTQSLVGKVTAAAKGPVHMVRGDGAQEKMLKNAKTQYFNEHEEISTYLALENFATKVGDRDTAKVARDIRREEERMAKFLEGQIKQLAGAVAIEDVPAAQRRSRSGSKSKARGASSKSSAKKSSAKKASKPAAKKSAAKKSPAKKTASKSTKKASAKKSGGAKKASAKKAAAKPKAASKK
jgi:ferritin-like metal-binding protein YciE